MLSHLCPPILEAAPAAFFFPSPLDDYASREGLKSCRHVYSTLSGRPQITAFEFECARRHIQAPRAVGGLADEPQQLILIRQITGVGVLAGMAATVQFHFSRRHSTRSSVARVALGL